MERAECVARIRQLPAVGAPTAPRQLVPYHARQLTVCTVLRLYFLITYFFSGLHLGLYNISLGVSSTAGASGQGQEGGREGRRSAVALPPAQRGRRAVPPARWGTRPDHSCGRGSKQAPPPYIGAQGRPDHSSGRGSGQNPPHWGKSRTMCPYHAPHTKYMPAFKIYI